MKQRPRMLPIAATALLLLGSAAFGAAAPVEADAVETPKSLVPYVSTPYEVVEEMLKMADVKTSDVVYDLGCGDGRIVIMAAKKRGALGVGVDINPVRIKEARALAEQEGVTRRVRFYRENVLETDFSSATVVMLYMLPSYNRALAPRLVEKLPVGARVVSHDFDNMPPDWKPVQIKTVSDKANDGHVLIMWKITAEMKRNQAARKKIAK